MAADRDRRALEDRPPLKPQLKIMAARPRLSVFFIQRGSISFQEKAFASAVNVFKFIIFEPIGLEPFSRTWL